MNGEMNASATNETSAPTANAATTLKTGFRGAIARVYASIRIVPLNWFASHASPDVPLYQPRGGFAGSRAAGDIRGASIDVVRVDLTADVGEGSGAWTVGEDERLIPLVSS